MGLKQRTWVSLTVVSMDCKEECQEKYFDIIRFDDSFKVKFDNRKMKNEEKLEDRDGEGGSFSSTRLGNHVSPLDDRLDCTLLDGRGLLKTISIDSPEMHDLIRLGV